MNDKQKLELFTKDNIRKKLHKKEYFYSIEDVISTLTNSNNPKEYIKKIRNNDAFLDKNWNKLVTSISIKEPSGKKTRVNCANLESILRIIGSLPSKKLDDFKLWIAKLAAERIKESDNPELTIHRTIELYRDKGYDKDWIENRIHSIGTREKLIGEWGERGVKKNREYSILTAEISRATFGISPTDYKKHKNLKKENLRDHMTSLELIFSILGETASLEIARNMNAQGFDKNREAARQGGKIAGNARHELEDKLGKSIKSSKNYLNKK